MTRELYLRPIGLYPTPFAQAIDPAARPSVAGLPLAGGWLSFAALEVIEREGGAIRRHQRPLGDTFENEWGRLTLPAADILDNLCGFRARVGGLTLDRPRIMGIVNITPDSFSDGGQHATTQAAIQHALQLAAEGADILDIGGESTRPGAAPVALDDELARVLPVIEGLVGKTDALISIDTRKAAVMTRAIAAGCDIINDVSALTHDPKALEVAVNSKASIVLMHAQGDPRTMNDNPTYTDVALDVYDYLDARIAACEAAGIARSRLIADPGIGFGKLLTHNVAVMAALSLYHGLGVPVLLGASRKTLIHHIAGAPKPSERLPGSIATALAGVAQGAQIVRVHDVAATRQALSVWQACLTGQALLQTV